MPPAGEKGDSEDLPNPNDGVEGEDFCSPLGLIDEAGRVKPFETFVETLGITGVGKVKFEVLTGGFEAAEKLLLPKENIGGAVEDFVSSLLDFVNDGICEDDNSLVFVGVTVSLVVTALSVDVEVSGTSKLTCLSCLALFCGEIMETGFFSGDEPSGGFLMLVRKVCSLSSG